MSKELPYFKFFIGEWLKGEITVCSMPAQGLFINLCVFYWGKDCDMKYTSAQQRFNMCSTEFEELLNLEIIEVQDEYLVIQFLDEQFLEFGELRKKKSRAGKASAKVRKVSKRSTPVQHNPNKGDKIREDKIKNKSDVFRLEVLEFKDKYSIPMLKEFYYYWSEPDKAKKKLRYEMEKTWETARRLSTWEKRSSSFKKDEPKGTNVSIDPIPENLGIRGPNDVPMPDRLKKKISQIGKD